MQLPNVTSKRDALHGELATSQIKCLGLEQEMLFKNTCCKVKIHYDVNKKLSQFDFFDTCGTLTYYGECLEKYL
jgi:hypothetical protein